MCRGVQPWQARLCSRQGPHLADAGARRAAPGILHAPCTSASAAARRTTCSWPRWHCSARSTGQLVGLTLGEGCSAHRGAQCRLKQARWLAARAQKPPQGLVQVHATCQHRQGSGAPGSGQAMQPMRGLLGRAGCQWPQWGTRWRQHAGQHLIDALREAMQLQARELQQSHVLSRHAMAEADSSQCLCPGHRQAQR